MSRIKWTRIIAVVLVLITVAGIFSACSKKNEQEEKQEVKKLSEMSDEELLQRLEEENITIPKGLSTSRVREYIIWLEADQDREETHFSHQPVNDLFEALRILVKEYYSNGM